MVVVGDYMNRMAELTGKVLMETLKLLEGASPESRGMLNKNDPELSAEFLFSLSFIDKSDSLSFPR